MGAREESPKGLKLNSFIQKSQFIKLYPNVEYIYIEYIE